MRVRSPSVIEGASVIVLMGIGYLYFFQSHVLAPISLPAVLPIQAPLPVPTVGFKLLPIQNTAFKAGEKLHYDLIYKGITVGHATIVITDGPSVNGRPTLQYVSKAESTHFFDHFFKVRDENVSTVDKASLFSLSFDQNLNEGHYQAARRYDFDYINKKFRSEEKKKGKTKKNAGPLQAPLHDVLSALYATRTLDLTPGRNLSLSIYRDNGGKALPIRIGAALKNEKTPFGTFSCVRVEPVIQGDSIFKSEDARLVVWMTNDEKKLPVLMEAHSTFGIVRVKLTKWEH